MRPERIQFCASLSFASAARAVDAIFLARRCRVVAIEPLEPRARTVMRSLLPSSSSLIRLLTARAWRVNFDALTGFSGTDRSDGLLCVLLVVAKLSL